MLKPGGADMLAETDQDRTNKREQALRAEVEAQGAHVITADEKRL